MNNLLLTGASGFLGGYLTEGLQQYFKLTTIGRKKSNDIICDLARQEPYFNKPFEWVVHNAGKAHIIPRNEVEIKTFYQVNYQGTLSLLQSLQRLAPKPQQFIFISTVAVYGRNWGEHIDELHPLNGSSAYAKSKIMAEQAVTKWCEKFGSRLVILRLPLIAGSAAPGNLGKLINAIKQGSYFKILNNPARKSIVLASDITTLISKLEGRSGVFNLTDSQHPTFCAIEDAIAQGVGKSITIKLPLDLVRYLARGGDLFSQLRIPFPLNTPRLQKMTRSLTFSDEKARLELGWQPNPVLNYLRQGNFITNS